jgi:hypothetical protein
MQYNKGEEGIVAWANAPIVGGLKLYLISPAVIINVLITYLFNGTKESKNFSNAMVYINPNYTFSYCGAFILILITGRHLCLTDLVV